MTRAEGLMEGPARRHRKLHRGEFCPQSLFVTAFIPVASSASSPRPNETVRLGDLQPGRLSSKTAAPHFLLFPLLWALNPFCGVVVPEERPDLINHTLCSFYRTVGSLWGVRTLFPTFLLTFSFTPLLLLVRSRVFKSEIS